MRRRQYEYNQQPPSVSGRIGRFFALLGIVFVVTVVVVVTQRLSDDALALLVGGIAVAFVTVPIVGLLGFILFRREQQQRARNLNNNGQPQVIVVNPATAALPAPQQSWPEPAQAHARQARDIRILE